ncbi:MAG TPA: YkgJ family cysteine cluster protein [Candidatus Hydrogenedentes bacterium]|nr:YkgJ family cysteine cluster protein [Candidatus Hydrogenedentota bacterium]
MSQYRGESPQRNPCLSCGACCAFYRCTFHWSEADDVAPEGIPVEMTVDMTVFRRAMKGTNQERPRCVALDGEIGHSVACAIYERRSSTCRDFPASYAYGERNVRCDKARLAHGLPPLEPQDWGTPFDAPQIPPGPKELRPVA